MNYSRVKFFLILILLFFINNGCFSQEDSQRIDSTATTDLVDSIVNEYAISGDTTIVQTSFNSVADSVARWRNSPDFAYMSYLDSLLRKKKSALKLDTFSINTNRDGSKRNAASVNNGGSYSIFNSFPVKIFFWFAAVFFIGFILYKIFFTSGLFERNTAFVTIQPPDEGLEKLKEYSAFNELIYKAESLNDFNLAVRYLFLQSLKKLADRELIFFSGDKTNSSYIRELNGKSYQNEFINLTRHYEFVWYGKFLISHSSYQHLKDQFISFNKKI